MKPMNTDDILDLAEAVVLGQSGKGRELRSRRGVPASAIGAACGVTASAITRWEIGERRPTGWPAIAWARLMRDLADAEQGSL